MRLRLLGFALLLVLMFVQTTHVQAQTPAAAIAYRARVLANGLRVYALQDRSRPEVAVQVWYDVGSKDDPPGRSGFAHLFEHLMFKGARDMPPEYIDQLTASVGGESNASTTEDYTEYHETAPADQLERLLWAEAERMGSLTLDQQALDSERRVVEHELKESLLDDPYSALFTYEIPATAFPAHPYGLPTIGSLADLRAATLAEVRAFHALYYRPDNAVRVVAGDFDTAQLDAWIDRYFAVLASPRTPPPRVAPAGPLHGRRVVTSYLSDPQAPAVVLTYSAPPAASADAQALAVLTAMIAPGQSSLGYATLVRHEIATDVFADTDLHQRGGMLYLGAIVAPGRKDAEVEAALRAQVGRLRHRAPATWRLEAAKKQLLVDALGDRETLDRAAALVGRAAVVEGDPARVNREIAALEEVTSADIQRVARRYLRDRDAVAIRYHAAAERPRRAGAGQLTVKLADVRAFAAGAVPAVAPPPRMAEPPAPAAAARLPPLPPTREITLANGLRVIVARSGATRLATAMLVVRGGSSTDPNAAPGLSQMAGRLALFGRVRDGDDARAGAYETLGLSPDLDVHEEATSLTLSGLAAALPDGLDLLAAGVLRPTLRADDLARARRDLKGAGVPGADMDALTDAALDAAVFGRGRPLLAGPQAFTRQAVLDRYGALFRPDNAILVLAGDLDPAQAIAAAEHSFGGWTAAPAPSPPARPAAAPPRRGRMVLIDLPGAPLAEVAVGAATAGTRDPARPAVELANSAIGGGYISRLSQEIRIRRGLTYDVSSTLEERSGRALFSARAETDPAAAGEVASLMLSQLAGFAAEGPNGDELAVRKALVAGDLARQTRTADDLADLLARRAITGAPVADLAGWLADVDATGRGDVQAAAAQIAAPEGLSLVIAGDARKLAGLRQRFPRLQVIEAQAVGDLARPG